MQAQCARLCSLCCAYLHWLHKRQCVECRLTLEPPLPAGTISQAVQPAVHDLTDNSVARSWLNNPLSGSLATDIYKATNIVRSFAQASCPSLCSLSVRCSILVEGCSGDAAWWCCAALVPVLTRPVAARLMHAALAQTCCCCHSLTSVAIAALEWLLSHAVPEQAGALVSQFGTISAGWPPSAREGHTSSRPPRGCRVCHSVRAQGAPLCGRCLILTRIHLACC